MLSDATLIIAAIIAISGKHVGKYMHTYRQTRTIGFIHKFILRIPCRTYTDIQKCIRVVDNYSQKYIQQDRHGCVHEDVRIQRDKYINTLSQTSLFISINAIWPN